MEGVKILNVTGSAPNSHEQWSRKECHMDLTRREELPIVESKPRSSSKPFWGALLQLSELQSIQLTLIFWGSKPFSSSVKAWAALRQRCSNKAVYPSWIKLLSIFMMLAKSWKKKKTSSPTLYIVSLKFKTVSWSEMKIFNKLITMISFVWVSTPASTHRRKSEGSLMESFPTHWAIPLPWSRTCHKWQANI